MGYIPPRGPDGKIIVGPLIDTTGIQATLPPAESADAAHPAAAAPSAASGGSPRRTGDLPTAFAQLRPGATSAAAPQDARMTRLAWLVAGILLAYVAWSARTAWMPGGAGVIESAASVSPAAATTPNPTPGTTPTMPASILTRAVVAYDRPDGQAVGALEPGRPYRFRTTQDGWRQLEVIGSGMLWVRTWEMDGLLPPTATPLPPTPVPVVPAIPQWYAPTAVPATRCKGVVLDGQALGQACGTDDAAIWATAAQLTTAVGGQIAPTATP